MKKEYETPEINAVLFQDEDVITTSNVGLQDDDAADDQ